MKQVVVIGAGWAGLTSALMLAQQGQRVTMVARGWGSLLLSPGTVSVLNSGGMAAIDNFARAHPWHPYARIGAPQVQAGISWLTQQLPELFAPTSVADSLSAIGENMLLPTALGAVSPTALVPRSMQASVLQAGRRYVVAGIAGFRDFSAALVAANLRRASAVGVPARAATIELGIAPNATGTDLARLLDESAPARQAFVTAVRSLVRPGETVLVPAVLGLQPATFAQLADAIGESTPLGEIPLPPPSVPGRRMNDALVHACRAAHIDILLNAQAVGVGGADDAAHDDANRAAADGAYRDAGARVTRVAVQVAGRVKQLPASAVVYAGGGLASGAIERDSYGILRETAFALPVWAPPNGDVLLAGILVDSSMRPSALPDVPGSHGSAYSPRYRNLYCVGAMLAGALPWAEGSGEGIALGSAAAAVAHITRAAQKGAQHE